MDTNAVEARNRGACHRLNVQWQGQVFIPTRQHGGAENIFYLILILILRESIQTDSSFEFI